MQVIGVLYALAALTPGEELPLPARYKAGWIPYCRVEEKNNLLPQPGIEP
jgi:hypothetical protein